MNEMKLASLLFRNQRRTDARESERVVTEAQEARAEAMSILEQARIVHEELMERIRRDEVAPLRAWNGRGERTP